MSFENIVNRVGFGCAGLLRLSTSNARQRVLDTAFDTGIRYFDVARSYGLGKAERELGKFIQRRQSETSESIAVATKFGIPLKQPTMGRNLGELAGRQLLRWFPNLRKRVRKHTPNLYLPKDFSVAHAEASLQASLRELQLERLDTLLLHEPRTTNEIDDDLMDWLVAQQTKGTIRTYGVAGYLEQMETSIKKIPWPVRQFEHHISSKVDPANVGCSVTFGAISNCLTRCQTALGANPQIRKAVADHFGQDPLAENELPAILIRYSLDCFPNSRALFSTTVSERLSGVVHRLQTLPWQRDSGNFVRSNLLRGLFMGSQAA